MKTIRLTMAQALVRHLAALRVEVEEGDGVAAAGDVPVRGGGTGATQPANSSASSGATGRATVPWCAGVWSIFGHGNVAGIGEALWEQRAALRTLRAHNEQAMAHAAIAFAKASFRRRIMAVTTSIGPGATNLVTAAALAHVDRLPVLLLPGDVFASRAPDPVLQQLEDFQAGDISVNDTFRPVTRYFDRILRPEQLLIALPRAVQVLTDPATCGPVCLALPQDVQAEAFDCPEDFLHPEPIRIRRPAPDADELARARDLLRTARRPLIVAGGGALYSGASEVLATFASAHGIPVAETHAGKSALAWDHPLNVGAVGVTGSPAANEFAREADVILAVGTRLQDFSTGSHALFPQARVLGLNVASFDAHKWHAQPLVADARVGLQALDGGTWRADAAWSQRAERGAAQWRQRVDELTKARVPRDTLPYDAEVIGAVRDSAPDSPGQDIVVNASGTLPAELHKLWRSARPGGYHMEYGFSCMGYEIAGGLGVKLAQPEAEVIVMVGDGSYLMLNSEIATSVMLGLKLVIVVLDNRGFGCINRLQAATGSANFNNLLRDCVPEGGVDVRIDFAAHAASLGAQSVHVDGIESLRTAMKQARAASTTQVLVIDTTHTRTTDDGGCWWDVAVPEVSQRAEVDAAQRQREEDRLAQRA